jgi:hypothetical protein
MSNQDTLIQHIHLNPLGAGMVIGITDWILSASGDIAKAFCVGAAGALGAFLMNKVIHWWTRRKGKKE